MSKNISILDELMGFMKTRTILTAADLDFFTKLDARPQSARELAEGMEINERAATRVLDSLTSLGLLKKESGRYFLTETAAPLSSRHPETILPMLQHMSNMWSNWSQLTETVQRGINPNLKPVIAAPDSEVTRAFIGAMHVIGSSLSRDIAASYNLTPYKCLLDIGGGSGTYTLAFLEKNPSMRAVIFDLADVIPMARERLEQAGLENRVRYFAGDFYRDELPKGCDIVLLSAIIHQNSQEENLDLFRKIYRALDEGGTVLIRDHIMDESRTRPPAGALFALNMLMHTRGGDTYTFNEVQEVLEQAGFTDVKLVRTGEKMDCLVEAKKRN